MIARRPALRLLGSLVSAALLLAAGTPSSATADSRAFRCRAGAAGAGDSYYPGYGNGGYDARRYDLDVAYNPLNGNLRGRARIISHADQDLCSFNLDLLGLEVKRVKVRGRGAAWKRDGQELVIGPKARIRKGTRFSTTIRYGGVPVELTDPIVNLPTAFMPTTDGANVAGQPEAAATWFPVNDHPSDKASYSFDVDVPTGYEVVANGRPRGTEGLPGGWTRWRWEADAPMASYLATIDIGHWDVKRWRTEGGVPVYDAVDPSISAGYRAEIDSSLDRQGEILTMLSNRIGRPYPFDTVGGIVDPARPIGFALETQTRPVYSLVFWIDNLGQPTNADYVVVHELAHQWFGDDIGLRRWRDIWLNEGFATYFELLWDKHEGGAGPGLIYRGALAGIPPEDPFWSLEIGDPGPEHLLDDPVYIRGAMTLQALRNEIGDHDFWTVIRRWAKTRAGGHGTTRQFISLAERVSGRRLDGLFESWLFTAAKPGSQAQPAARSSARADADSADARAWLRELGARLARGTY